MFVIILIIILINFIFNITGLYYIIPFIICIINLIVATFRLIIDPQNLFFRIVQIISLGYIIYIIFLNIYLLYINIFI